jgi:REP element-mobilizing transposase RayT
MVVGYLKGKSAIQIHREALNVKQGFTGKHFWSRGYCVSARARINSHFRPCGNECVVPHRQNAVLA